MRAVDLTKTYLKECVIHHRLDENKNTHLEHLEDLLFNEGLPGAQKAINYLTGFYEMLKGSSKTKFNLTTKWDGRPAVFVGTDPSDGKFFVGTKGVFNKEPKLNKSIGDIKANHPDKVEKGETKSLQGLRDRLTSALQHLKKLNIKGVLQGDLLFTPDSIQSANIDGTDYIVFKPNTIIYAIPKDSELAKEILRAKIGIVFHTEYTGGPELADMKARFGFDAGALTQTPDVWFRDAIIKDYSGQVTMTKEESDQLKDLINTATINLQNVKDLSFLENNTFGDKLIDRIKASVNKNIRNMGSFEQDPAVFADNFINDYKETLKKSIAKLTTDAGQVKKTQLMLDGIKYLESNKEQIKNAYVVYLDLIKAKDMIREKLSNVRQIDTFVQNAEGDYEVTGEEGFVAVDHIGNAIKIVDRLDFSAKNFGAGNQTP